MTTNKTNFQLFSTDIFQYFWGNASVEYKDLTIFIFELIVLTLMAIIVVAFPLQAMLPYMMTLMGLMIIFILI